MVYFTTFIHNSPRLPLYKYQGETGGIVYECSEPPSDLFPLPSAPQRGAAV